MHPLAEKISALHHRLVVRRRLAAICWTLAALMAAALLLGFADYLIRFHDRGLRMMATAALVAAVAAALYRWWYLPSRQRLGPLAVARRVESHFPQLRDSLASAWEFLHQSEHDRTAGSAQLRRVVVAEAQTQVDRLALDDVIDRRPLRRAAAWLTVAAAVALICLALDAAAVRTALVRLAAPWGDTAWPRQNHLEFRDPPLRLAAGQPFEVELVDRAGNLPDDVRIEYRMLRNGRRETASDAMTRVGDVMVARREGVREPFAFRAEGGDDRSMDWIDVDVLEPPQIEEVSLVVHPPPYTGLSAYAAERHLEVLAGSGIELRIAAREPLTTVRVVVGGHDIEAAPVLSESPPRSQEPVPGQLFHIPAGQWIAEESGPYRIEIQSTTGVTGTVGPWNLRVQPDTPPSVQWQRPADDLYVLPGAVVPLELLVKDNLAVARVEIVYERTDSAANVAATADANVEVATAAAPGRLELYRGPENPPAGGTFASPNGGGEVRVVDHAWELAPLELPAGAQLVLRGEAIDYRPGTGRTIAPRRITIVTPAELDSRLANRQSQIVRQLERALAAQRTTREDVRRVEIQFRDAGSLSPGDRNTLQSAELGQRRVGRILVDPAEGMGPLVDALLDEVAMNRIESPEILRQMRLLTGTLDELAAGLLPVAEHELTAARKAAEVRQESEDAPSPLLAASLAAAGVAAEEVIATVEELLGELSGWADFQRFERELAALRLDQLAHQKTTRDEIGLGTLPLELRELSRDQRAGLNKAAAGEEALVRRLEEIERGMQRLASELAEQDETAAGRLADALALARRLAIVAAMQETARDLSENRVGRALAREGKIADDIQQVIDLLRNRSTRDPQELADKLRQAEAELAALREALARLREAIARAEQQGAADPAELARLRAEQEDLRDQIAQLARELGRIQADDAGRSTARAAGRLADKPGETPPNDGQPPQPAPSSEVQQAEADLAQAAEELAARRQQAEQDLALEIVRRFQAELGQMVERQQQVVIRTAELDRQRGGADPLTEDEAAAVAELAREERDLGGLAREHSEVLFGLGSLRVSLEDTAGLLESAAEQLDGQEIGPLAQIPQRRALARLQGMLEAYAQTAAEAGANQNQGGAGAGGQQPQRRPTFELLEVKVLRLLQVDLNERTREHQQQAADAAGQPDAAARQAALAAQAAELAAEQGRLAELVEEILARDNDQEE